MVNEKLHKVLADAGLGSRREIERWIAQGRVTVNNHPARIGQRVDQGARIKLDGRAIKWVRSSLRAPRVLAYHKPVGEICTRLDPDQRPTVFHRLPKLITGRWICVGRLDINTSGLLLFTDQGALADLLMHPRTGIEREYVVRVNPALTESARTQLLRGVNLDNRNARIIRLEELRQGSGRNQWYRMVLTEGRYREVRRLCDRVGVSVSRLARVRFGSVHLDRSQAPGSWRELNDAETRRLVRSTERPGGKLR